MAKYTKIPEETFKQIQLNAGVLLSDFDPSAATVENSKILGATTGGTSFTATPSFTDFGEDIDNCPKNTKELKRLSSWEVKMTGTFVTITAATAKMLMSAANDSGNKITPRNDLEDSDFADLWWVGDYSDQTGATNGGYVAIHMHNGLSTGGFSLQSTDKAKGNFAFEFTGHYSISEQDTVPFEVYVKAGTEETQSEQNGGA